MENRKESGSYYTPEILSEFLCKHIFSKYLDGNNSLNILEPSSGDGQFLIPLTKHLNSRNANVDLVDINEDELGKATNILNDANNGNLTINPFCDDFINFDTEGYDLIIGNPPYISKKLLTAEQIKQCSKICKERVPNIGEVKNIWPAFLIKAIDGVQNNGIVCYVLPSELLQVKYARGLRELILDSFDRVEIFAFNELIFKGAEQDVVAFIGIKTIEEENLRGVSFYQVNQLSDLKIPDYTEKNFNVHRERLDKWTNYILSDDQLNTIDDISNNLNTLSVEEICEKAEVGIVTAANKYFIRSKTELLNYNLRRRNIKPILHKTNLLNGNLTVNRSLINKLKRNDLPINLVSIPNVEKEKLDEGELEFIREGEEQKLHEGHKLGKRTNWYSVPSIWASEAIFSKRSHFFPRVFLNEANILVTDTFYRVICRDDFDSRSFVFSFYNSLTLVLAELEGRFYGGGVLELIPTEFRSLLIPYNNIDDSQFSQLEELFHKKSDIEEILDYTDPILLNNLDQSEINQLRSIRRILFERRTKVID